MRITRTEAYEQFVTRRRPLLPPEQENQLPDVNAPVAGEEEQVSEERLNRFRRNWYGRVPRPSGKPPLTPRPCRPSLGSG
jgi:hypothetical protein